jgi:addiction module HigA family antidote
VKYAFGNVPHPGATLREVIRGSGRTQTSWAQELEVSTKHLSLMLNGKARYTAAFAVRFETISKVNAGLLMRLQADYLVDQARSDMAREVS